MFSTDWARNHDLKRFVKGTNAFFFLGRRGYGGSQTDDVHRCPETRTPDIGPDTKGWELTHHSSTQGGGFMGAITAGEHRGNLKLGAVGTYFNVYGSKPQVNTVET